MWTKQQVKWAQSHLLVYKSSKTFLLNPSFTCIMNDGKCSSDVYCCEEIFRQAGAEELVIHCLGRGGERNYGGCLEYPSDITFEEYRLLWNNLPKLDKDIKKKIK